MGQIHRIDFNRNGSQLYVLGESLIGRYDPSNLERVALERPSKDIPQGTWCEVLAIHPDSREVLVAYDRRVVFLDPQTLKAIRPGWDAGEGILDARYTPDGNAVLIGRRDNLAELLDAATGKPLVRSMPHARAVVAVAISPDGSMFLTGSRDSTARFWDAKTGLPLGPQLRHAGPVTHVTFPVTGDRVATGTGTGQVTLWPVPQGDFGTPPSE
jgi:WD40 repeat protein